MPRTPQEEEATLRGRFERQLFEAARKDSGHRNWVAAGEPSWTEHHVLLDPGMRDIPVGVLRPRARTFAELVFPGPLKTGLGAKFGGFVFFLVVVGLGWLAIGIMWPRLWGMVREAPLLIVGFVAVVYVVASQCRQWRADCIRDDAEKAVKERGRYLDSVFLLTELSRESRDLVESYRSMRVREETVWTAARLLLEVDEDRNELDQYRKFLPPTPSGEDPNHPLYGVLGRFQDRINTRMHTIAVQVADDVETIAKRQEAAR